MPYLSARDPIGACKIPQAIFWTAIAKVKSAAVRPRSCVTGGRNRPRHWRMPMARLIVTAAPIRIGSAFGTVVAVILERLLILAANVQGLACGSSQRRPPGDQLSP